MTEEEWPNTDDAQKWAQAFVQHKKQNNWTLEDIDEGLLIGWFANAIEHSEMVRHPDSP